MSGRTEDISLALVTGGAGSGKSAYAEQLAVSLHEKRGGALIYCATMHRDDRDPEIAQRIARHRRLRAGKGFETVEEACDLANLHVRAPGVLLLEDLSNLLANACYLPQGRLAHLTSRVTEEARRRALMSEIVTPVLSLTERGIAVVAVTNEIFSDGVCYEAEADAYLRNLASLNCLLASRADFVTEVVFGIPLVHRQKQSDFV